MKLGKEGAIKDEGLFRVISEFMMGRKNEYNPINPWVIWMIVFAGFLTLLALWPNEGMTVSGRIITVDGAGVPDGAVIPDGTVIGSK